MRRLTPVPSLVALFLVAGDTNVVFAQVGDLAQSNRISSADPTTWLIVGRRLDSVESRLDKVETALRAGGYNPGAFPVRGVLSPGQACPAGPCGQNCQCAVTTPVVVVRQVPFVSGRYITPVMTVRSAGVVSSYSPAVGVVTTPTPVRTVVRYGITNQGGCENGRCPLR